MKAFTKAWGEDTANKTIYNDTQAGAGIAVGQTAESANVNGTTYRSDEQIKVLSTELANVVTDRGGVLDGTGSNQVSSLITAEIQANVGYPDGYINGLLIANNGTDSDHDIDFGIGKARDALNTVDINATAGLTKQIDATWASGDNAGGLASGVSLTADTTYHCFVLSDGSTGYDFGFDTSVTAVNLLADASVISAGFTKYRRVGSVITDGSANIIAFNSIETSGGDLSIRYISPIQDYTSSAPSGTDATVSLTVPSVDITAIVKGSAQVGALSGDFVVAGFDASYATIDTNSNTIDIYAVGDASRSIRVIKNIQMDDATLKYTVTLTSNTRTLTFQTLGYVDHR